MSARVIAALCSFALLLILGVSTNQPTSAQSRETTAPNMAEAKSRPVDESSPATSSSDALSPDAPIAWVLDDGYPEGAIGFGIRSYNESAGAIWLNRFSPGNVTYPVTIDYIQIAFPGPSAGNFLGRQIRLLVYLDSDSNNDPRNAPLIYQSVRTIQVADWYTFQAFAVGLTVNTPGDLYIGWEDLWAESCPTPFEFVAAQDRTRSQHRSWVAGAEYSCVPNIYSLGVNYWLGVVDTEFGYPGNWMIRAIGHTFEPATATPMPTATPTSTPTPRCPGERFTDVCPPDYFYTAVIYLNDRGIVSGYADGSFRPYNPSTRAQLSKIIVLAEGWQLINPSVPTFVDVPVNDPFYAFIETAYDHGIISGYSDGTFRPGNNVTRGQTCKIVVLAEGWPLYIPPSPSFSDVPVGSAFYPYVETAYSRVIISGYGDGTFRPQNDVTRGQLCKIVYNAVTLPTPTPTHTIAPSSTPTHTAVPTLTDTPTSIPTDTPTGTETTTPIR